MKVYFAASPRGTAQHNAFYKKIFNEIRALGFTHVDDDVVKYNYVELVSNVNKNNKAYTEYANKKLHSVQTADICIFDVSDPSLGIGFLIERALQFAKPVIMLYYYKNHFPFMFAGLEDDKLILRSYNEKNLKKVLKDSLDQARQRRDRRFNFFINPKLLDYIEDASHKQGVTKSKFIRNLILEHMRSAPSD